MQHWNMQEDKILRDSVSKYLYVDIKTKFLPHRTVSSISHRANRLKLDNTKAPRRRSKFWNLDFWKEKNDNNAYWAGFCAADGCVFKRKKNYYGFTLALSTKDKTHLLKFAEDINYVGKIYNRKNTGFAGLGLNVIDLSGIGRWKDDLEHNFSITPNKTHRFPPPNLSLFHSLCYLRGLIDGDGSISTYFDVEGQKTRLAITVVSCNELILNWMKLIVDQYIPNCYYRNSGLVQNPGNSKRYTVRQLRAAILFDLLSQLPTPFLERKWLNPKVLEIVNSYKLEHPNKFLILKDLVDNQGLSHYNN